MKHTGILLTFLLAVPFFANAQSKNNAIYQFDKPLYGAAYYSEYTPTDRLDEDIQFMKNANLSVVRIGESTWSLYEPQDGVFQFDWMDRILEHLGKAGIKVILGTPTYSIPAWMSKKHPEILSQTYDGQQSYYGIRQNMDLQNPIYRKYCERIIRKMMEHFAKNPAIIGYQVDNEVEARNIDNEDYFLGFRDYIKSQFNNNLDSLNRRWGLNYWGMNINSWDEFYDRKGVTNPSYKLWWERWNRKVTSDFLNWQIDIVNEYKRPDQFVTHCFMPAFSNIDQVEAFRQMEYPAINVYYNMQDAQDGLQIGYSCDYMRNLCRHKNFLVTETNAQGTGWSSRDQWPPYDGQLRQNMYMFLSGGANMVEYWHWNTLHYGQETYWRGILGHDMLPNRVYAEFQKGAIELNRIGNRLVNLKKQNRVAVLFSHDSKFGLDFMPYKEGSQYNDRIVYEALYKQNIECD
ncbi:MAG: beta-galactosidase, partial [Parabacteroides sp.]